MRRIGSFVVLLSLAAVASGFCPPSSSISQRRNTAAARRPAAALSDTTSTQSPKHKLSDEPFKQYESTSDGVKGLVGGLTALFNIGGVAAATKPTTVTAGPTLELERVVKDIEDDYVVNNYLWTGKISEEIFDEECVFTDPTLSFQGLSTYKKNIKNLQWLVPRFMKEANSELYAIEFDQETSRVYTRWRMYGGLKLPWQPRIDVIGRTRFTLSAERGNRVVAYDEIWEMEAADALLQIITPAGGQEDK